VNTVIGLLPNEQKINRELNVLDQAGFSEDDIQIITLDREVEKYFSHEKFSFVTEYAGWGALIVGAIYTIFAIAAAWCDCTLLHYSFKNTIVIIPLGLLVGGFIGGFLGLISGIAEFENKITPYTQGVQRGGHVIAVQVDEAESEKAKQALQRGGISRVKILSNSWEKHR
jgi:hypothetical protein